MKYLNKRDEFLNKKVTPINENESGAGPFENDLGWHDSLLGRLIDHSIRKAKIRYNIKRMKPLTERLESEFDRINAEGAATQLSKENWVKMVKLKLFSFYDNLKKAVDNNEDLDVIKSLTDEAIKATQSIEGAHEDFNIKETLLKELKLFRDFLENYKEEKVISNEELDKMMVSNLEILLKIMRNPWVRDFKKAKEEKVKEKFDRSSIKVGGYYLRRNNDGKINLLKVTSTDKDTNGKELDEGLVVAVFYRLSDKKWMDVPTAVSTNSIFKEVKLNGNVLNQEDISLISKEPIKVTNLVYKQSNLRNESLLLESDQFEISDDAKGKLKSSILLLTKNDKDFSITPETLENIISNFKTGSEDGVYIMNNLYKEIFSCLKGRRKSTISDPDPLVKESYDLLVKQKSVKIPVMGELIAKFAKISKQFEEGQLYKKLGTIGELLHTFNESLDKIMGSNPGEPDYSTKKEEVKESLMMYDKFVSYIKEADEPKVDREVSNLESNNKIKEFFDRNCKTVRNYVMEKTEAEKLGKNLEELEKEMKDGDSFIIDGMDPIIEICRLFNRAFKLYITRNRRNISKRSEGTAGDNLKYSSAFLEYTDLGGSNDGPWRNNKLFDIWEDAVYKILGDRKYQHIFSKSTRIRIPKVPDPQKPEDYELRENAGANLRRMITDLLDGDDLYKIGKGEKGKQNEFLSKYFGDPDEKSSGKTLAVGNDAEENKNVSEDIKTIKLTFSTSSKINPGKGLSFAIEGFYKDKDQESKKYKRCFFVVDEDPKYLYMIMSTSFDPFKKYLDKFGKIEINYNGVRKSLSEGTDKISYTRIEKDMIDKLKGQIKIVSLKRGTKDKESSEIINIQKCLYLNGEDGSSFKMDSNELSQAIKASGEITDHKKWFASINPDSDPKIGITKIK